MAPFGVRQFRRLLAGCVTINLVAFILATMSSVLAGQALGDKALTGVSLASPLFTFGSFLMALIGAGTGINYSLRRGRLDLDGAESVFMQGVWTSLAGGVVLGLLAWLFRDSFIALMSSDPEVVNHAVTYWRWLPFGLALMCFSGVLCNCCYCDGDTFFATVVSCSHCLVALGVSAIALKCGYGSSSCSLGFSIGYLFAFLAYSLHFLRKSNTFSFSWRFCLKDTWVIVKTAAGDATGFLGDVLSYVLLGYVLSSSFGLRALIGLPVYVFVVESHSFVNGFASAMQPIVAVYYGERNARSVRTTMTNVFVTLVAVCGLYSALLVVFPELVPSVLGVSDPSAVFIVRVSALMIVPGALINVLNNYFQLIEHERLAVALTVFYWMVFPALLMLVFPVFGDRSFWWWSPVSHWVGAALFAAFMLWRYGRNHFPLLLDREREAAIHTFDLRLCELDIAAAAESVSTKMLGFGVRRELAMRARLLVEESLMVIKERNGEKTVFAEVTLDLNDGIVITLRDDGVIFDITDADARVSGLRTYLVATMMQHQSEKSNILTTGFNRNVFRL